MIRSPCWSVVGGVALAVAFVSSMGCGGALSVDDRNDGATPSLRGGGGSEAGSDSGPDSGSGSSSGAGGSSSSGGTGGSGSSGAGPSCGPCTTDMQCQIACPPGPGGASVCCHTISGRCYATSEPACPSGCPSCYDGCCQAGTCQIGFNDKSCGLAGECIDCTAQSKVCLNGACQ